MSDVFFDELAIPRPDHHLGIGGGPHGQMTGRQLEAIEEVLIGEKPDRVLVYGDTNSTLAGALAAAKLHIPVAHVEAGLRSFNRRMPEEINRILTDHVADALFVPTETAMLNLRREGFGEDALHLVGDVMFDASLFYRDRARRPDGLPDSVNDAPGFVLATIHRAENTDDGERLRAIFEGLASSGKLVVLPLHPRTRAKIEDFDLSLPSNILAIPPVGYLEMIWLEMNCAAVATDSGGMQKEAYFFGKPCVTLRDETEWSELVEAGCNRLVGADRELIAASLQNPMPPADALMLYGDGTTAERIVSTLLA
jgi:UDP-GlcNAc3NAcA epimerase